MKIIDNPKKVNLLPILAHYDVKIYNINRNVVHLLHKATESYIKAATKETFIFDTQAI